MVFQLIALRLSESRYAHKISTVTPMIPNKIAIIYLEKCE
ncbi:Uncharacterised protein [Vibrio cholerae]|uniref:Uncharacterized protein n=1 Tax=Vibrio cholerae TaxID=666 RepID=A0A655X3F9_VIBCL|nr:Uncharacterised protein [Vibrio cholerae]CSA26205.1 Uncharacterised protein [Vibrio cholerae]CSB51628.1 Uncharacterised protein [Vibrio cholerae]CSB75394.1 Uncharacterised protein [Vibrio cholerae]CSC02950.1 Uncharacterised protein [Vibrio cholerae]